MKRSFIIFFVFPVVLTYAGKFEDTPRTLFDFVDQTQGFTEGFIQSTGTNDFKYHSFRPDITECLLTRATDGKMSIEWETAVPQVLTDGDGAGFIWIAAMDMTPDHYRFDFYFNDIRRFVIQTGTDPEWTIEDKEGACLQFFSMEVDHNGDAHGYMALKVPVSWLVPGKPQRIRITGEPAGSNAWIIVYKANDAADFLRNSVIYNKTLQIQLQPKVDRFEALVEIPALFAGEKLTYSAGRYQGTFTTETKENTALGQFSLPLDVKGKEMVIRDEVGEIVSLEPLGETGSSSKLLSKAILKMDQRSDAAGNIRIEAERTYNPKAIQSLRKLAGSGISKGTLYLMNSSHQDIAWMDSPEKCMLERDTMLLTPLFEMASVNPHYRFDVEDALMLKEYIERHPGKKTLIAEMLDDGRISCGSTYIQPYEEMYSGEALARQFYFGSKWLKDEFNYNAKVYWNMDVPGRTLQMPQIMKKAGTEYLMMSRFEKGFYRWYSPDGSSVIAFSPGHYADAFTALQKNFQDAAQYIASSSLFWGRYYPGDSPETVIPLLSDWDMSPAVDYTGLITEWEKITEIQDEKGNFKPVILPGFRIASGDEFFESVSGSLKDIPEVHGERPAIWLYIHGPSHQQALKASREGDILLTQAEKFATVNAWIDGSYRDYPEKELRKAWEAKIYPDHGWGGKNGDITDNHFLQKFLYAKHEGEKLLSRSLKEISGKIKAERKKGIPLVVFNSLSWSRTDVVTSEVSFDPGETEGIELRDAGGNEIPVQIIDQELYEDGSLKSAEICFIASGVPSIGYKTFYLRSADMKPVTSPRDSRSIENDFYRIELGSGGIESIYDKETGKELIDASKFRAGEVFTMRSVGNGAGEFADVQQPSMEGFDKTGKDETQWTMNHSGPVYSSFRMRQPLKHAVVEEEIIVYHDLKRIDFLVDLVNWEGILYREFRFALPLDMDDGQVVYEVPYGVLEAGKDEMAGSAGERYIYPCRETRPRGIQNWIGAYDEAGSVILSSSVAVADFLDPTDNPLTGPVLQPVLLASRKSCHWEGNDYLQTGNHSFRFSLTSTPPGWRKGYKKGIQANEALIALVADHQYREAVLPEEKSFLNLDQSNVMVTTIKKAEDAPFAVIRLVEMEGQESQPVIESFMKIRQVEHATLTEKPLNVQQSMQKFSLPVGHHAIETYLLK